MQRALEKIANLTVLVIGSILYIRFISNWFFNQGMKENEAFLLAIGLMLLVAFLLRFEPKI